MRDQTIQTKRIYKQWGAFTLNYEGKGIDKIVLNNKRIMFSVWVSREETRCFDYGTFKNQKDLVEKLENFDYEYIRVNFGFHLDINLNEEEEMESLKRQINELKDFVISSKGKKEAAILNPPQSLFV